MKTKSVLLLSTLAAAALLLVTAETTAAPPIEGPNFAISTDAGPQSLPDVACNSTNQEFLVVWQDTSSTPGIYGRRVRCDGTLSGSRITISAGSGMRKPAVAYDSAKNRYLVVWEDGSFDIYGQLVSNTGSPVGSNFVISNMPYPDHSPDVAYNPAWGEFLVVWEYKTGDAQYDIYGRRVTASGSPVGSYIPLCTATNDQVRARVAYNSASDQYLVAWQDERNGNGDIYGQRVNDDGTLPEGNFAIETTSTNAKGPAVACSGGTNGCLVAWYEDETIIYGRLIPNSGLPTAPRFEIINATDNQKLQDVAYHPGLGEYLVAVSYTHLTLPTIYSV